jgi:hypothetical protein
MKRLVVIFMMLGGLVFADWQVITDVDAMTDEQSVMYVYMEETFPILAINIKPNNPTIVYIAWSKPIRHTNTVKVRLGSTEPMEVPVLTIISSNSTAFVYGDILYKLMLQYDKVVFRVNESQTFIVPLQGLKELLGVID